MRSLPVCLALLMSLPTVGLGQEALLGATFEAFRFPDPAGVQLHHVELLTLPFGAAFAPSTRTTVSLAGAYASGSALLSDGSRVETQGLTDASLGFRIGGGGFALNASAVLPTGEASLPLEGVVLVGVLSSDLLPFEIGQWGTGGSIGADVEYSGRLGGLDAAVSAGYVLTRAHAPLAGESSLYDPGNQQRLKLSVRSIVGEAGRLSVRFGVQRFGSDRHAARDLYRSGMRVEAMADLALPMGARKSLLLYGGARHRSAGVFDLVPLGFPSEESPNVLAGMAESVQSRQLVVAGVELFVSRRRFQLVPEAQLRVLRSADGVGQGWLASLGAAMDYRIWGLRAGRRLVLRPSARMSMGRAILREGAESDIVGWRAGLSLRLGGGGR